MIARRISTVLSLLSIVVLVYALIVWGAFRRLMLVVMSRSGMRPHPWSPRPNEDPLFGIAPSDIPSHIDIAGLHIPLSVIIAACLTIQLFPIIACFAHRHRRHRRYLNDECIECGHPITKWRGRCSGCGVRIGPG